MKKSFKKVISTVLITALMATMVTGCGSNSGKKEANKDTQKIEDVTSQDKTDEGTQATTPDISEHVVLKGYFIGDEGGIYADEALANINKVFKEKLNVTLEPSMISWSDYRDKLPLIYASGEAYDFIYTANWLNYSKEAVKGAFMDIKDLMPMYAPQTYAEMQEMGILDSCMVNDGLYMFPSALTDYTTHTFAWREDLREKYNCAEITDYASLVAYCDTILENEPEMLPINLGNQGLIQYFLNYENDWSRPIVGGDLGVVSYNLTEGKELFNLIDTPQYEEFIKRQREWYQKGYWSKSVLSETMQIRDQFLTGKSAISLENKSGLIKVATKIASDNPDWKLGFTSFDTGAIEIAPPTGNGTSIGANSKHPERALMLLELLNQDEELYRTFYYGPKGITWDINEDGKMIVPEGVDPATINLRNLAMGINVGKYRVDSVHDSQEVLDAFNAFESRGAYPAVSGFVIDDSKISAEIAAINNVVAEYKVPLDLGVVDPEKGLPELKKKLQEAGIDKVMEVVQKQLDDYNASR